MRYLALVVLSACTMNTGTGMIGGGVFGAGVGAIGGGGRGALIGSAAGVIAGGLIGASLDEQDRKVMEKNSTRNVDRMDRGEQLTINDVIKLSQGGVSDDMILRYLKQTESFYQLSQTQVRRLQEAGVSQRVINEMIASASQNRG